MLWTQFLLWDLVSVIIVYQNHRLHKGWLILVFF
jgi:hypothetical protein